jgi:hypothetical protein
MFATAGARRGFGSRLFTICFAGAIALLTLALPARAGADQVLTFGYTGGEQSFVVPAGVSRIGVVAVGAPGERGENFSPPGPGGARGLGARVKSVLEVTPGQVLFVNVGGPGPAGGFNGGGQGNGSNVFQGGDGGDGGGATDLRTCSRTALLCPLGGSTLDSRLLVAGGGGGGGGGNGGQPQPAGDGGSGAAPDGAGGDGTAGQLPPFSGLGGQGGSTTGTGNGGQGNNGQQSGAAGVGATGGTGGDNGGNSGGGGGGGGGLFGGGGGGSGFGGGGGGAGSSAGPAGTQFSTDTTGVPSVIVYMARPVATTEAADDVTRDSATLRGSVDPNAQETTFYVEYGTDTSYGQRAPVPDGSVGDGTSAVAVDAAVAGLVPGTTYHYRLVAANAIGVSFGQDRTFTTDGSRPAPPSVLTGPVASVTENGVELLGSVNPGGLQTDWQFEFGRDTGEVQSVPVVPGDAGDGEVRVAVQTALEDLEPETTYRYRLVASNSAGTGEGAFRDFTTRTPPPPPVPASRLTLRLETAKKVRVGRSFVIRARVTNRGQGAAKDVTAVITLPAKLRFTSGTGSCGANGRRVTCRVGALAASSGSSNLRLRLQPVAAGRTTVRARAQSGPPNRSRASARLALRIKPRR